MFKLDKSTVLKYYCLATILCLYSYKIITHSIIESSNIFIQLSIGLNLILVGYYLFKENVVLNGSENLKTFFVACTSEYFLIWELIKLLGKSQDITIYYTNYAYFGLILMSLGLYQRFPKVFEKFVKFNFGFSCVYINTFLLQDYNLIRILTCSLASIIGNYYYDITFDIMTVYCTNFIYFITLIEAITILGSLIPIERGFVKGIIGCIFMLPALYIYISKYASQIKDLKNIGDDGNLEGDKISEVV